MTRSRGPVRVLAVLVACAVATSSAQPAGRDVWIGALLVEDDVPNGGRAEDRVALQPVASLVDGQWHVDPSDDPELDARLRATSGRVPAEWLPLGRTLPVDWAARLLSGRAEVVQLVGALAPRGIFDHLMAETTLQHSRRSDGTWSVDLVGVAASGPIDLRPFVTLQGAALRAMLRDRTPALVDAELATLAAGTRTSREVAPSRRQLLAARRTVETAAALTRTDGSEAAFLETMTTLPVAVVGCDQMLTGVLVSRRPRGAWQVRWTHSWLACEGLYISHRPLAEIERDGRSCWVQISRYEDGTRVGLTSPNTIDDYPAATCDIR